MLLCRTASPSLAVIAVTVKIKIGRMTMIDLGDKISDLGTFLRIMNHKLQITLKITLKLEWLERYSTRSSHFTPLRDEPAADSLALRREPRQGRAWGPTCKAVYSMYAICDGGKPGCLSGQLSPLRRFYAGDQDEA